jgi:hypothetical protein
MLEGTSLSAGKRSIRGLRFASQALMLGAFTVSVAFAGSPPASSTAPPGVDHVQSCPGDASLRSLAALGSVYIGEVHGTEQAPALVGCLADYFVATKAPPFTVSLELPPSARDLKDPVWSGTDGRTSRAMAALVGHLLALEKEKKLSIDFQIKPGLDYRNFDRDNGMALRDLAAGGRVIALSGNMHAQRRQAFLSDNTIRPAGSFTGSRVVNVMLDADGNGSAWNCMEACGIHPVNSFLAGPRKGELRRDNKYGYDFVYVLDAYTPSLPFLP